VKRRLKWNRTGGNEKSVLRGEDDTPEWSEKLDWNGALDKSHSFSSDITGRPVKAKWRPLHGFSAEAISHNAET
jgi:hypothetical protein